ncbi:MAG: SpoIIE family protein phosphatase [Oscillospiraceae bacterium]|nr:SpoIIE family protein phosphatase [Oscillospiraceae bacterium]
MKPDLDFNSNLDLRENITRVPIMAAAGLLLGLTSLFGGTAPFAAIFISVLSGMNALYALSGALIGFFISGRFIDSINIIAVLVAVAAFRFFVAKKTAKWSNSATALLTGIGIFATTVILKSGANIVFVAPALGLISGFGSYAAGVTRDNILTGKNLSIMRPGGYASVGLSYILLIAVLANFDISMLNFGIFAGSLIAVAFSYKFRYAGGAICGVLSGFGIVLIHPEYMAGGLAIAVAATAAALFARLGKYTQMAGYILATGIFAAFTGIDLYSFAEINSIIAGGIMFMFIPVDDLTRRFRRETVASKGGGADVSEIFARRLKLTGEAMGDVRTAIEKTAEILDRAASKDVAWVYNTACGEVCRRCRHNMVCWGTEYNDTVRIMSDLTGLLRKGKVIKTEHLYGPLAYRCGKREQLAAALNNQYREFTAINTANRKITQMRTILLSQISATQTMMLKMSGEFGSSSDFDKPLAAAVENLLFENGIFEPKAAVTLEDDKAAIEAYGKGRLKCSPEKLCGLISSALRREFDLPEIINSNNDFMLTMFERASFSIEYGVYQVSRSNEKNCGDYIDSFIDKKGFAYIILSDGMGSGGRARIDSAFACGMLIKLLRAGVDISAAIEIINNSLLVKSADESFATLDVCRIDLYSGDVELFKAGSAPTYISCNKQVVKAGGKGLPVGINHRPVYERQSFTIGNSDLIIMASDGAELSERWLEHELGKSEWGKQDMNHFAQTIANAAKYSSDKEREDDISVIAVKLVR